MKHNYIVISPKGKMLFNFNRAITFVKDIKAKINAWNKAFFNL